MSCNFCTSTFNSYNPLLATVQKSGSTLLLYMQNQSRSIINVQRALLCIDYGNGGTTILYLRPNYAFNTLNFGSIEQGTTYLEFSISASTAKAAQAEVEYWEVDGRSVSCNYTF